MITIAHLEKRPHKKTKGKTKVVDYFRIFFGVHTSLKLISSGLKLYAAIKLIKCVLETFKGNVSQSLLPKKPLKAKEASLQCAQVVQHHPAVWTGATSVDVMEHLYEITIT